MLPRWPYSPSFIYSTWHRLVKNYFFYFHFSSAIETVAASEADLVDLYPFNGGYSVMGVDAESAVGLLGLLLFIDLMRVQFVSHLYQIYQYHKTKCIINELRRSKLRIYESCFHQFRSSILLSWKSKKKGISLASRLKKNHNIYWWRR